MAFQDPYEQLISDLGEIFRPQREWVQYRGLLLQFAVFFSAMAGGVWLVSLFFNLKLGFGISLVFVIASAVTHLFYLGRPSVAWRMFLRPHKAWISRGIIGITLFLLTGLLYSLPVYFSGVPWGTESIFGKTLLIVSILSAAWLLIYKGFVFASSRGIVSWNMFLVPLIIASGLTGACGLLMVVASITGNGTMVKAEELLRMWVILQACSTVLFYLWIISIGDKQIRSLVMRRSHGKIALAVHLVLLLIGILLLFTRNILPYTAPLFSTVIIIIGTVSFIADFHTTYGISRAGVYRPLIHDSGSI
jgi:DMSO reductase anchor subunit